MRKAIYPQFAMRVTLVIAILAAWMLLATPASADLTVSVAPSLVEVSATGSGSTSQELTVFNEGSEPFSVTAAVQQYKQADGDRSAVPWLHVSPQSFDLAPGQKQKVDVSIAVPGNLSAGGRYAVVAFKTGAKTAGGGVGVSGQLGVPFLISAGAAGALSRQANIDRLLPVVERDGRLGFRTLLASTGNLHVVSKGGMVALDGVGELKLPESTAILPGSSELLAAQGVLPWQPDAAYHASARLDYAGKSPAAAELSFHAHPGLAVNSVGTRENPDRGPSLLLDLRNVGELGLLPRVQLAIRDASGKELGSALPDQPPLLWPGQSAQLAADFPQRLSTGKYSLLTRIDYGVGAPIERQDSFQIGTPAPPPNPAWGSAPARATEPESVPVLVTLRPYLIALLTAFGLLAGATRVPALAHVRRRSVRAMRVLWGAE